MALTLACQVPKELLNTRPSGLVFKQLPRDPANVNAWKIICNPYINPLYSGETPKQVLLQTV